MKTPKTQTTGAAVLSWRVGRSLYMDDDAFAATWDFLRRHRRVVDEVAFFETFSHHGYLPLELYRETAAVLWRRMATLREGGVRSVGINVLTTVGHVNEGWDILPPLPYQAMVGLDGAVSKSCACPNTPELRAYVRAKYMLMAEAGPDFIWVDDDIRMHHHGVTWACFCPTCLRLFAASTGRTFEREALAQALNDPQEQALRQAWLEQNLRSLETLLAEVADAIHTVNPAIRTGLMTCGPGWTTYSGYDYGRWFGALRATKGRPGGGFYEDDWPIGQYGKALETGRQCALMPAAVTDRPYELENFPYTSLGKATTTVVSECTLALATGCNGIAFNALGMANPPDRYADKEPLARRIRQARPFWDRLVPAIEGLPMAGFWPAWRPDLLARHPVREGEPWITPSFCDIAKPEALGRIGLPLTVARGDGGTLLAGRIADCFSDDELRTILSGPVLMDAFALEVLVERGLADLAGVRIARWLDNGMAERFTDDPLNGASPRAVRDIRPEFWGDPYLRSALLEAVSPGVRVLSDLENLLGARVGPCVTAFANSLGGRVVVMGHAPWRFVNLTCKRSQLLAAADWATGQRLPVLIRDTVPLIPLARLSADRTRGAVVLLNAGLDPIGKAAVELRVATPPLRLLAPGCPETPLAPRRTRHGWTVTLHDLPPWHVVAVTL